MFQLASILIMIATILILFTNKVSTQSNNCNKTAKPSILDDCNTSTDASVLCCLLKPNNSSLNMDNRCLGYDRGYEAKDTQINITQPNDEDVLYDIECPNPVPCGLPFPNATSDCTIGTQPNNTCCLLLSNNQKSCFFLGTNSSIYSPHKTFYTIDGDELNCRLTYITINFFTILISAYLILY